jgi:hypothetical protein
MNPFLLPNPSEFPKSGEHCRVQIEVIDDCICQAIAESNLPSDHKKVFKDNIDVKRNGDDLMSALRPSTNYNEIPHLRHYSYSTAGLDGVTRATVDKFRGFIDLDFECSHPSSFLYAANVSGIPAPTLHIVVNDPQHFFDIVRVDYDNPAGLTKKNTKNMANIMINGGNRGVWEYYQRKGEKVTRYCFGNWLSFEKKAPCPDLREGVICPIISALEAEIEAIRARVIQTNAEVWRPYLKEKFPRQPSNKKHATEEKYEKVIENKMVNIFNEYKEACDEGGMDMLAHLILSRGLIASPGNLVNEWDGFKFRPSRTFTAEDLEEISRTRKIWSQSCSEAVY